jgi:hypothetical protein
MLPEKHWIPMVRPSALGGLFLGASMCLSFSAAALTPLKSPEQLAKDEVLFARASRGIAAAATPCFKTPAGARRRAVTIRFFVGGAGTRVAQFQVLQPRSAPPAMRRAAIRAITACAPYTVPDELRNWGGFWATVTFR